MSEPVFCRTRTPEEGVADTTALFEKEFGTTPDGVWAAPGRVNLIGEHVDYATGICLPFALTQLTFAAMKKRDDSLCRLVSIRPTATEVDRFEIDMTDVGPGNPSNWAGYAVGAIWAAKEAGLIGSSLTGFDIALTSDVPLGAGLSSSAALECSVAVGAYELLTGKTVSDTIRRELVPCCIRAENDVVGASTGGLDQRISLLGRKGHALEIDYADGSDHQIPAQFADHHLAILVMNTNAPHSLADGQYASRRGIVDQVADALAVTSWRELPDAELKARAWAQDHVPHGENPDVFIDMVGRRIRHIVTEIRRTHLAVQELKKGAFTAFGVAMQASHNSLRDDYEVSCPELDTVVDAAMDAGAYGARMTGGGFGGSAIALIKAGQVEHVARAAADAAQAKGLATPEFLSAVPGDGARRLA